MKKEKLVSVVIVTKDRKKDLLECLDSYRNQSYKNLEVIVVDNASRPPLLTWLPKKYPFDKLVTSDVNLGAAQGRNRGLAQAEGEYILFTDDDAYADKNMVKYLVEAFDKNKRAGIVQPLVYDKQKKNLLQGAGHEINLLTGRIKAWGVQERDTGQYEGLREVPMCGCVWMVKWEVFKKIGNYDEDYFIPYEDSDFSIRTRKAGFKLYCYSKAKTWHQGKKKTYVHPRVEWLGITSPERAFRVARNKIIFMRKHSPFPANLFFFFVMLPAYILSHSLIIMSAGRFDILGKYWLGVLSGIFYSLTYPLLGLRWVYRKLDTKLFKAKMLLVAWSDPVAWVIDKKSRTVLDLGCGPGKQMQFVRLRAPNIKYAEGVDLFNPYLKEAKNLGSHEKLVKEDVRKAKYGPKSFDVVVASHVLEHLSKREGWTVLANMERIAKRQVIVAAPIGEMYHPAVDGNVLQIHKSAFTPEEFRNRGYRIVKYGRTALLGEEGLVHGVRSDVLRKILYMSNILATPIYYLFPSICDYVFVAYKQVWQENGK